MDTRSLPAEWHMGALNWRFWLAKPLLPPSASGLTDGDAGIGLGERACGKEGHIELEDAHGS